MSVKSGELAIFILGLVLTLSCTALLVALRDKNYIETVVGLDGQKTGLFRVSRVIVFGDPVYSNTPEKKGDKGGDKGHPLIT